MNKFVLIIIYTKKRLNWALKQQHWREEKWIHTRERQTNSANKIWCPRDFRNQRGYCQTRDQVGCYDRWHKSWNDQMDVHLLDRAACSIHRHRWIHFEEMIEIPFPKFWTLEKVVLRFLFLTLYQLHHLFLSILLHLNEINSRRIVGSHFNWAFSSVELLNHSSW